MTSGTDELRRMLDEQGVEWGNIRNDGSESDYLTEWQFENNQGKAIAIEWAVGSGLSVEIHRYHLTPEQAIAATLGSGECKRVMDSIDPFAMWVCDHCGHPLDTSENFCGGCGRKVVDE